MTIELSGRVTRGDWALRLSSLSIDTGVTAVVGANGSGKTTLGRLIAGLDRLDRDEQRDAPRARLMIDGRDAPRARLMIDGRVVDEPSAGVFTPAHERGVGVVFQDHRLFGHLSAIDNVAFGLRRAGLARSAARRRAAELLEQVGVAGAPSRLRPAALSGGQRQRVAVARALAPEPAVLIADEPLASVDRPGRMRLRTVLAEAAARQVLLITHDPVDVRTWARAVVVIDDGSVASAGTLEAVTASPGCEWAAAFLGANVVAGTASGMSVVTDSGLVLTVGQNAHGPVHVTFAAHSVTLHRHRPAGSARNAWQAKVRRVDVDGELARISMDGPISARADITRGSVERLSLAPGVDIWASAKATEMSVVEA